MVHKVRTNLFKDKGYVSMVLFQKRLLVLKEVSSTVKNI